MKITFMPMLFFSTIILSGPAWCSQLCYFGGLDNLAASSGKKKNKPVKNKTALRHAVLGITAPVAVALRLFRTPVIYAIISASALGIAGAFIIAFISTRKNKMIHCLTYCPVGTAVLYLKYLSPFRMLIDKQCNNCMKCSACCRYDALGTEEIKNLRPGISCTLCGDCVASCSKGAIRYGFFKLHPDKARNFYLVISISLHAAFLGLARV
jgi:polyferredoxin